MARASAASSQKAIQAILPAATTFYLDLSNADPGTTGAAGMATTRQSFTPSSGSLAVPSVVSNANAITVPTPGTTAANYALLYDAATGGNFIIGAPLAAATTASSVAFAVGAVQFTAQ